MVFPAEVYRHIFDHLLSETQTLASCRLVNKFAGSIATAVAFRHVRLRAACNLPNFVEVAKSEALRPQVREITIDTWIGPDFTYGANSEFHPPRLFFQALPLLRLFTDLKVLNLRFNQRCGNDNADGYDGPVIDENYDFRYVVLDTVFQCLAGTWSSKRQHRLEDELINFSSHDDDEQDEVEDMKLTSWNSHDSETKTDDEVIQLHTFTVSNLADFDDERLTSSDAFRKVIRLPSLKNLKLLVATENDHAAISNEIRPPEKHVFFKSLPRTWLSPSISERLRVLSLYSHEYWGWNPKMDFRTINPGTGRNSGLPNLRVLALGCYVFSHEWQVDWIANLGIWDGQGGLEELYLDDCPIMWQARVLPPLDDTKTICQTSTGEEVEFSNEGYLAADAWRPQQVGAWNPVKYDYPLRWSQILSMWKECMTKLRVFKMGHGGWTKEWQHLNAAVYEGGGQSLDITRGGGQDVERERIIREQQLEDTVFLNYDRPAPPEKLNRYDQRSPAHKFGSGLSTRRIYILLYVYFNIGIGPSSWVELDFKRDMMMEEGLNAYEASRKADEDAYAELLDIIERRRRT
ncbi:hypothetical protein BX600DRAFT_259447 [Xylariales sp. PMI_506]|nr:hypothetical protein BX600DRAFT_259447 [Xylariales sp. PMI_506]